MADDDPQWYKDAIVYELHVRAFADDDGDGVGDFRGLTNKLDYLLELGVTAVWLLPFYPSPLRDDGYDISNYRDVHEIYGSLRDFEAFLEQAHRRGLRVIIELVLNHTSDQHAWFQRARRAAPGSSHRDFYVWTDEPETRYSEARIIFRDFESSNWAYDRVAKSYYWHRFYAHQPDLNFANPAVLEAMMELVDYWFDKGVDGMRLDAIPYLYEREGTDCENLPETHTFLKQLRRHVDERFPHRLLLAEANQWPEDAVAYFGDGDECHMSFHFPLMPRLFMALHMEDRFPIVDILEQTPEIPSSAQWALFLRNHDELTLEMVTDEERDYMYRVYAADKQARVNLGIRRRLAPLLGNDRRSIELMNGLLLSLPGTPVLYYGDEMGMGDNVYLGDRNGVRTPMQWSSDRNAGFSRASPQRLFLPLVIEPEYHYESLNVEAQAANPNSLLWWMRRIIALRKSFAAFGRGSIEFLRPSNRRVLVYLRRYDHELLLVAANLSRFPQAVSLDLHAHSGLAPVELFGRTEFPVIGPEPYLLTLGPKSFYWFSLQSPEVGVAPPQRTPPSLRARGAWTAVLDDPARPLLRMLPEYLAEQRWFAGRSRVIKGVELLEVLEMPRFDAVLLLIEVSYEVAPSETYQLPLTHVGGSRAHELLHEWPRAVLARLMAETGSTEEGALVDASYEPGFARAMLETILRPLRIRGRHGSAEGVRTRACARVWGTEPIEHSPPSVGSAEHNTSIVFGDRAILKLYRHVRDGRNPEVEVGHWLTERTKLMHIPPVAGHVRYTWGDRNREPADLAVMHGFVGNEGDAWSVTLDAIERFLDEQLHSSSSPPPLPGRDPFALALQPVSEDAEGLVGPSLELAQLLGRRTAQLHVALATPGDDPAFGTEPFSPFYRRAMFQSLRTLTVKALRSLSAELPMLPETLRDQAQTVLLLQRPLLTALRATLDRAIQALRIRIHGDLHLGQVLHTGHDVVLIGFEGEPERSIEERRSKRCPLRDVASMVRSFHYAAQTVLRGRLSDGQLPADVRAVAWVDAWYRIVAAEYVRSYLVQAREQPFLARASDEEIVELLRVHAVERAILELDHELHQRPGWVAIPLSGITELVYAMELTS